MNEPKRVYIEDLKVGDEVYVALEVRHGWSPSFRYPIYRKDIVERITPKKTKLFTKDLGECNKYTLLYLPSEETERRSNIARAYKYILVSRDYLNKTSFRDFSDEDILKIASNLVEIRQIVDSYAKKED